MRATALCGSLRSPKILAFVGQVTMGYPAAKADSRNNSGRTGVHQSGWTLEGAIGMRDPRLDWCRQESTMPAMMKTNMTLPRAASRKPRRLSTRPLRPRRNPGRSTLPLKRSTAMWMNSIYSTCR